MYQLPVGVRRAQQMLRADPHLEYKKLKNAPFLTKEHEVNRMKRAHSRLCEEGKWWDCTMFSDEKQFSMNGLDDWSPF